METINLNPSDWLGIDNRGLFKVNSSYYNPNYYTLIPSNDTQRAIINRVVTTKVSTKPNTKSLLDKELKQLDNMRLLANKIKRYHNLNDKLRYEKDENKFILGGRKLSNYRLAINKYLENLKGDGSFRIEQQDNNTSLLIFEGEYVRATKTLQGCF